ncbi:EF-P 5-aminopentanol modification-associated protein YfmF [Nosocomiicoccus ampullae]|uniref:Zn-dependent peptidase n=1 Tax=Nosocomiicoccus ampullae TaxID=489910 RepID=A0A9Q2HFM3_9STAP|nr:insulinase family protein [Nosocomiicoccus ampullae]MBB5176273.1 putative Zn-dependent peptidase [Nosocomiicoccus ampullae]QYA47434.1 insulinase family protein [Nosocomiicoccus ampullae]
MDINKTVNGNIPIVTINTDKFKTFTLRITFRNELDVETVTLRNILARMMIKRTKTYDTEAKLIQYLSEYYGAHLTYQTSKIGSSHLVHFTLEFVNERFIHEDLDILENLSKLLNELLNTPFSYDEKTVEYLEKEKRLYKNRLKSMMDNSMQRAYVNLLDEMFGDSAEGALSYGKIEDIDDITIDDIKRVHESMMSNDEMMILLCGNINDNTHDSLEKIYSRKEEIKLPFSTYKMDINKVLNYKVDHDDVEQSKAILGFKIDKENTSEMAVRILNTMFGGSASSYLFKHLREERSLAYQISSTVDIKNGLLFALAGVDHSRVKETEEHILIELEKFQNGDFTDEFLEETKNKILSDRQNSKDRSKALISIVYNEYLMDTNERQFIEKVNNITREDIIQAAKSVHIDTVYTLTGGQSDDS